MLLQQYKTVFVTDFYGFVTICNFLEFSQKFSHFFPFKWTLSSASGRKFAFAENFSNLSLCKLYKSKALKNLTNADCDNIISVVALKGGKNKLRTRYPKQS